MAVLAHADPASGIWYGSASVLAKIYSVPRRTCQDSFEKLEKKGYLKRFQVQGKHGSYPVLINRFECTDGALKGMRLNAMETESYDSPVYEKCADGAMTVHRECADGAPKYLENREQNKEQVHPQAQPAERTPKPDAGKNEEIYFAYPRHVAKTAALKAIAKVLKTKPFDELLRATQVYAAQVYTQIENDVLEARYVPYPATWFNEGHYDDDAIKPVAPKRIYKRADGTVVSGKTDEVRDAQLFD